MPFALIRQPFRQNFLRTEWKKVRLYRLPLNRQRETRAICVNITHWNKLGYLHTALPFCSYSGLPVTIAIALPLSVSRGRACFSGLLEKPTQRHCVKTYEA